MEKDRLQFSQLHAATTESVLSEGRDRDIRTLWHGNDPYGFEATKIPGEISLRCAFNTHCSFVGRQFIA
jgi:hypothetical protein